MTAYYNEIDPFAADWLRGLIRAGLIAPGEVDERSIADVQPGDLEGYSQVHLFGGIGGWSLALRLAGWPDDEPCWTGSCPCQPFSCAGKRLGDKDPRHLWPAFLRLIAERRPATVFGEQVASKAGREWLAGVRADLEELGYAVGAADLPAACVGAPQKRQRLYWVSHCPGCRQRTAQSRYGAEKTQQRWAHPASSYRGFTDSFGNSYRIPQSEIPFLDDGFPGIVDIIRGYGNAIVPQVGAEFIRAYMETRHENLDSSAARA